MSSISRQPNDKPVDAAAWAALLRVHALLVPLFDRQLRDAADLPLPWYDVLLELHAAPDRQLRMSDLGERVVLSRSRVSRVVDELVASGLVRREANPDDQRSALATLTNTGERKFRKAAPIYRAAIARHFTDHLDGDSEVVARALERVLAAESSRPLISIRPAPDRSGP